MSMFLVLILCYLASIGPMCVLCIRGHISEEVIGTLYYPIEIIAKSSDMASHALNGYLMWWVTITNTDFG